MKAITIENLVAHIRPLRTGKTFLCNFINDCKIIDVVPMETIDKMIAEIKEKSFVDYDESYTDNGKCLVTEDNVLDIINKYCKGAEND